MLNLMDCRRRGKICLLTSVAGVFTFAAAGTAFAQTAGTPSAADAAQAASPDQASPQPSSQPSSVTTGPSAPAANTDQAQLADIVVTAEKRESTAQRVPAALQVLSNTALERQHVVDVKDLNSVVPNVQIIPVVNSLQVAVRGIGSTFLDPRSDPAVSVSVNGLFYDRPLPNGFAFLDVARVEVLNGPQGTLYGRNAATGALNIVTNRPTQELGGFLQATVGSLSEFDTSAVLNVPLTSTLAVRAAYGRNRRDGYLGDYYNDNHSDTARLSALWKPTDRLTVYLEGTGLWTGGHGAAAAAYPCPGTQPYSLFVPKSCSARALTGNIPTNGTTGTYINSAQLQVDYDFGGVTLTSISGYVGTHQRFTNSPSNLTFTAGLNANNNDYTQELRLTGHDTASHAGGFAWQIGGFLFDSNGNYHYTNTLPAPYNISKLPQRSQAVFAQATYGITDALRLTGGVRYTHDFKGLTDVNGTLNVASNRVTYKVGAEFDVAPGHLLYGSFSTGYVPGGGNGGDVSLPTPPNLAAPIFRPETVKAYEVGVKNRFINNRLTVNAAVYYYDIKDYQYTQPAFLNTGAGTLLVIENASSVKTYGAELITDFAATRHDRLSATVTYGHGTFGDINLASFTFDFLHGPPHPVPLFISVGSGTRLVNLPQFSALLGYEHTFDFANDSSMVFAVHSKLSTDYNLVVGSTDPIDKQKRYTMTDLSLSYHFPHDRVVLQAFVKNVENTPVVTYGQTLGAFTYGILPPRTYGGTVSVKF